MGRGAWKIVCQVFRLFALLNEIWSLKFENCQVFRLFAVLNKMQNNHRDGLFHLLRWKACLLNKFPILKVIFFCISITRKGWYILIIALDVSRDWHIVLITLWLMAHCQHICCDPSHCIFWPYSMLPSVWHVSLSSLLSPSSLISSSVFNTIIIIVIVVVVVHVIIAIMNLATYSMDPCSCWLCVKNKQTSQQITPSKRKKNKL